MFHDIPAAIKAQMARLEAIDARDRVDGTPQRQRLRQISPETGRLLAMLAANTPQGIFVEIGTSAAYSTLWLALSCLATGRKITTFEIFEDKAELAAETIRAARLESVIELVVGDALHFLPDLNDIAFCFLDAEKDMYIDCYEAVIPKLVGAGVLVADNVTSHSAALRPFVERARNDRRTDSLVVPVGKGLLICRKI